MFSLQNIWKKVVECRYSYYYHDETTQCYNKNPYTNMLSEYNIESESVCIPE